jgi:hypothetical protein
MFFCSLEILERRVLFSAMPFPASHYPTSSEVADVAAADFNGDGATDIAAATFSGVSILYADGSDGFAAPVMLPIPGGARGVTAADVDGDGHKDLIAVCWTREGITVFKNDGAGGFGPSSKYGTGTTHSRVIAFDADRDGDLDVAALGGPGALRLYSNDGLGTFAPVTDVGNTAFVKSLVAGDFDGDGDLDLAYTDSGPDYTGGHVYILSNNGSFSFTASGSVILQNMPFGLVAGDVDRDGDVDLVVTLDQGQSIKVLKNTGGGSFSVASTTTVGFNPDSVVLADLDADGDLDAVVADGTNLGSDIRILRNNSAGVFASIGNYPIASTPAASLSGRVPQSEAQIALGDIRADGTTDVFASSVGGVSVLREIAPGRFQTAYALSGPSNPTAFVPLDFDSDGHMDLVITSLNSNAIGLWRNAGGALISAGGIDVGGVQQAATAADFNRDGLIDIAALSNHTLVIARRTGPGQFAAPVKITLATSFGRPITAGDLNQDGWPDLVLEDGPQLAVLYNDRAGNLLAPLTIPGNGTGSPYSLAIADIDQDEDLDIVSPDPNNDRLTVTTNNGNGTFVAATPLSVGDNPVSVISADLNGDGLPDLASSENGTISVLVGQGAGNFAPVQTYAAATGPFLVAADLNADGIVDLSSCNISIGVFTVLFGRGNGTFDQQNQFAAGQVGGPIAALDVDADGDCDLVSNAAIGGLVVLPNLRTADTQPPVVTAAALSFVSGVGPFGRPQPVLQFTFSEDVAPSFAASDIRITNLDTGSSYVPISTPHSYDAYNSVGIEIPRSDGNYRATLKAGSVADLAGNPLASDFTFDYFLLAGDANGDRIVDVTDLGILATNWQGSSKTLSQGDFNYDGKVDVTDLGILATNWQKILPAPSAAAPGSAVSAQIPRSVSAGGRSKATALRSRSLVQDIIS